MSTGKGRHIRQRETGKVQGQVRQWGLCSWVKTRVKLDQGWHQNGPRVALILARGGAKAVKGPDWAKDSVKMGKWRLQDGQRAASRWAKGASRWAKAGVETVGCTHIQKYL